MKQIFNFSTRYSRVLILLALVTFFKPTSLSAQTWTVQGGAGSAGVELSKAICADAAGNIYITGSFTNTNDFDLGTGTANLTVNGGSDIFIASYTSTGAYRWAVRAGGTANDNGQPSAGICTDGTSVYVTGNYNGAATLFGATSLTPNGGTGTDAYVAKLNASTGAWIWAVSMGGTGNVDHGMGICLDPSGNPYVLGSFNTTMSGACANVSLGGSDIFVSKLNPATGACVWLANGGSTGNDGTLGGGICYDPISTELVVASNFSTSAATFGGFSITNTGGIEMCVLELNSSTGAWLGAVGTGSATNDDAIACAYDPSTGDVMVAGALTGNMTLPGGIALTASSAGSQDAWFGRYSISTNGFIWAKSAVSTTNDRANGIAVDGTGSVLITGQYGINTTSFGSLSLTNTNAGGFDDIFVVGYAAGTGNELWVTKNTNSGTPPSSNNGRGIAYAGSNNFWVTGQFAQGATFGVLGPLNSNGFNDFYVAKLNAPPTLSATQSQTNLTCNGICNGSATVVASGGTAPYTYSWSPSGGSGATASSLCAGSYTCTITDANLASITKTFTITQPPAIVLNANSQTNVSCFGGSNGAASVTPASGGTGGFTYNWTPGNPTGDGTVSVTGLIATTYTCTVTDANSCTKSQNFTVTQPPAIVVTPASQTNVSCFGGSNGAASINTPTGGAGGFTYNWTPGNPTGDGTVSVTGLTAGTWTCTVTDANSCTATQNFTVTAPTAITVTPASQTNVSCFGGSNGAASINTPTGGAGGYTYNWTPGNPTGDGTVSVTGLTAQTYTCTVTDANSCTRTQNFTITAPTAIVVTPASQTNVSCFGGSNGAASINTPTGGAGGYTYNWTPGNPTGDGTVSVTGLTPGTWTCTVTDANSCTATQNFTITSPTAITVTPASQTNVSCFGGSNGAASINTPTGGAGGYTYNWTPGNPTGDGTVSVTGLTATTWTCTVTDANGCTRTQNFTVTAPTAIVVTPASQTNVSCFGGSNGAASINTPTGGAGGFTYNWTPGNPTGDGTVSVTGLTPGTWTCTVTDANSCTATQNFTVTAPTAIVVTPASQTNVSCFGGSNGAASINTPTGGAGGYTYNWTPGNPTGDGTVSVTGLTAGTWTCTVTDANSCTATQNFTVTAPTAITASIGSTASSCSASTGTATVSAVSGGAGGYTYNWTPGTPTGDGTTSITGLSAGTWTCTITDANGCVLSQNTTVTGAAAPSLTAASQTNVACFGGSNGAASVNAATGGAGGYTYNWTPGNPTGDGTTSVTGLTAGTWTCTVTDAGGCTGSVNFTITSPTAISLTAASQTNISCFGGTNGAASVNAATGGAGGYTYNWTPGNPTGDGTVSVTGLSAQTYTCTVTDANGCTATQNFTITAPTALTVTPASQTNVSCFGGSNGAASINTPTGGAGGYTYNWTPGNPTGDGTVSVTGLTAQTYTCTVTDANSCTSTQNFTVTQPTAIVLTAASQTNVSCFGGANGTAAVNTPTGGAGSYTYNWTPGNPTGDGTTSVTGLTAGTWTCTTTDANGCTAAQNFTITQPISLVSGTTVITNVACNGGNTGAINLSVFGGTPAYTFNWGSGITSEDRTGLAAGTYSVTITDGNGCTSIVNAVVTQPASPVSGTTVVTNVACSGGTNGAINLTSNGGVGGYTFNWGSGITTEDRTGLAAGTYSVTITDANGCTGTVNATVTQPASTISGTTVVTNVACNGGATGAINLTPTGGAPGYTFNWGSGITTEDRTGLTAGTYSVTITDANGCTGTANATVTQPTAIVLTAASQTNISCFGGSNGAAAVNAATGGAGGYTYNWTPGTPTGDGTVSVTGLTAGTWTCTVTDANGCTAAQNFTVTQPTAIVLTAASQTNVSCNGGTNGAAAVNAASGGAGGYTYDWTPGTPSGDGTVSVTGLTAGTWTCTVTDANGCTTAQNFTVTQPTPLVLTAATQTNVSCFGGSNGAAAVNAATGGAGSYTYNWTPGNPTGDGTISVTGLSAQTYTCTVTDANGCTTAQNFTITQPTAIAVASSTQTNVSCFGGSNGTASISTPTGGAGAFTYNWTPGNPSGDGTTSVTGLTAGTWTCTVTDANGCTNTQNFTITQPTALILSAAAQTNVSCFGENDGAASVNAATGGVGTYAYDWSPGTPIGEGTTSVTGLTAGTWTCTVSDLNGCTTNQVFNITQPAAIASSLTITDCDSYTFNAQTYTVSGTYTQLFTSVSGCDSTVTLNLTINNSNTSTLNITACGSYTLNTQTYTTSGTYVQNLTNVAGCDSTLTLNLIINQPSASTITQASCYGYTLNGQTYTASGTYTQTLTNAAGCDSTITLNLTIFNATSSNVTVTACDSYTLGNQVYTASGVYVDTIYNVGGCDSIVTLNLTINQSSTSSFTAAACEFYNWNGTSYNASGVYTQTFTNAVGCDSVVTLNLTINLPYENTTEVTACDAYVWNGQTYTTSGIYTVTNPNMNGCDSTEHLDLTIVTSPTAGITVLDPIILHATGTGTYQWIDCATGQALPGETDQNFVATYNSSYAVIVSNGNCSDTSNCAVINTIGLDENNGLTAIQMVPNPASEEVIITWTSLDENATITLYDAQGKEVLSTPNFKSGQALNVAQFETGMYIVLIKTTSSQSIERLIKQ